MLSATPNWRSLAAFSCLYFIVNGGWFLTRCCNKGNNAKMLRWEQVRNWSYVRDWCRRRWMSMAEAHQTCYVIDRTASCNQTKQEKVQCAISRHNYLFVLFKSAHLPRRIFSLSSQQTGKVTARFAALGLGSVAAAGGGGGGAVNSFFFEWMPLE